MTMIMSALMESASVTICWKALDLAIASRVENVYTWHLSMIVRFDKRKLVTYFKFSQHIPLTYERYDAVTKSVLSVLRGRI